MLALGYIHSKSLFISSLGNEYWKRVNHGKNSGAFSMLLIAPWEDVIGMLRTFSQAWLFES